MKSCPSMAHHGASWRICKRSFSKVATASVDSELAEFDNIFGCSGP